MSPSDETREKNALLADKDLVPLFLSIFNIWTSLVYFLVENNGQVLLPRHKEECNVWECNFYFY